MCRLAYLFSLLSLFPFEGQYERAAWIKHLTLLSIGIGKTVARHVDLSWLTLQAGESLKIEAALWSTSDVTGRNAHHKQKQAEDNFLIN